jgi:hypothetical protein
VQQRDSSLESVKDRRKEPRRAGHWEHNWDLRLAGKWEERSAGELEVN